MIHVAIYMIHMIHVAMYVITASQPLMADMLEAIQSSKYSYILNLGHSDTLGVRSLKKELVGVSLEFRIYRSNETENE